MGLISKIAFAATLIVTAKAAAVSNLSIFSTEKTQDFLVQLADETVISQVLLATPKNSDVKALGGQWFRIQTEKAVETKRMVTLANLPGVVHVQPNYKVKLLANPGLEKVRQWAQESGFLDRVRSNPEAYVGLFAEGEDNPAIPTTGSGGTGADPLIEKQWGMKDTGAEMVWAKSRGREDVVVAVIDTGVDYTHEDLSLIHI